MAPPKRCTLLLCLIHHSRVALRDALVDTFLKCLARIHTKGKEALARLHEQQRALVEELIGVLAEVLDQAADDDQDDAKLGGQVRSVLVTHGGAGPLRDACALIAAASGNNYLPGA
jgi:hypothetical protein